MTNLTDRMRTLSAFVKSRPHETELQEDVLLRDAADLLIEASDALDLIQAARTADALFGGAPADAPMQIIPPVAAHLTEKEDWSLDTQGADPGVPVLPSNPSPRACPKCDSRAQKIVHRAQGRIFELECPVCWHHWKYTGEAKWV